MSVMDMNSRMAMAENLSVQQLQQAVQSGSLPAYIGIPLIEQKTKEKSQMAAAQQGQQKPPSVAASILQQAEQQEQQQGISQLPSNLPMMEEGEDGYAGGGIVAFANGDVVEEANDALGRGDLEQINPMLARTNVPSGTRFLADAERLRDDPAYRAFAEQGGIEGDTRYERFLEMGNSPAILAAGPEYEPAPATSPAGDFARDVYGRVVSGLKDRFSDERQAKEDYIRSEGIKSGPFGVGTDYDRATAEANVRRAQAELAQGPGVRASDAAGSLREILPPSVAPTMNREQPEPTATPPASPRSTAFMDMDDTAGTTYTPRPQDNAGIAATPGARTVPPGTPGAPRPASRTAPTGSTPPARGALPATLDAAERSDSPAANKAVSMLDKYVAQLEKGGNDIDRDKKEALYMALIQGGLGMMGGTSPNAFANIAAGLLPATQAYQQAISGIKKGERERLEKLISTGLKKEEFLLKAEEIGVKRDTARMVYDAAMARTGAMGGSGGGKEDRLLRQGYEKSGMEFDSLARRARVDMDNALKNDSAYTGAKTQLAFAKNLKPEDKTRLETIIRNKEAPYLADIQDYRDKSRYFMRQAGMDLPSGGGGNMPKGIPQGSRQVGTSGGKPVYESPDGKRYIVE